ncbi:hypothetical protein [Qipengyuania sp. ASV99]|uniref:hypothetical protein n=1 Tax=Qipengyuania sp. ASV99 TaxID=3399681 RepID=UPI003A4C5742
MLRSAVQAHRTLAAFLLIFIVLHFASHFAAIGSIAGQSATRRATGLIYQFPLIEAGLIAGLAAQIALGITLLRRIARRKRKGAWHWLQFASGAYLAIFIVNHTASAVITRLIIGLDTNFYWPAGTLLLAPLKYGFAPYYVLAVTSLCSHLLTALHFRRPARWHAFALMLGPIAGCAIVAAYAGMLYPIELPREYLEYFDFYPGVSI